MRTARSILPLVGLVMALCVVPFQPDSALAQDVTTGMVQLRITSQAYDPVLPWNKISEQTIRGNAIVVQGNRLVTTADLVKNATLIQAQKFGRYPDFTVKAVLVDYDLNLALLEVQDKTFWKGLKPLPLAKKPLLKGLFTINRWRGNGRLEQGTGEMVEYRISSSPFGIMEFPVMRGNTSMSGLGWGEVLTAGKGVIGLLTSHSEQRVQALNSERIDLFIQAATQKPYRGLAHRGFSWQRLDQTHLRAIHGLKRGGRGVLVRKVYPGGTGGKQLKESDILLRIGGFDVDPEGRVEHPDYGLIPFTMIFNASLDENLPATVLRNGKNVNITMKRARFKPGNYRVPQPMFDGPPDFELFGGLVVRELSLGYLQAWGSEWQEKAPTRLMIEYNMKSLNEDAGLTERVVIISRVLSDPANIGYEDVGNAIITGANGSPVTSLASFRQAIEGHKGPFHTLNILPGQGRGRLVYDATEIATVNARIRERYAIPR